jgi:hypothetical protein
MSWMSHISSRLDGKLELVLNIQPNSMLDNFIPIGLLFTWLSADCSLGLQIVEIESLIWRLTSLQKQVLNSSSTELSPHVSLCLPFCRGELNSNKGNDPCQESF